MSEEVSAGKVIWYSFLYSLALVPLSLFLGGLACLGGLAGGAGLKIEAVSVLGFVAFGIIVIGSFYLSYSLGREKAAREAAAAGRQAGAPPPPANPGQGA